MVHLRVVMEAVMAAVMVEGVEAMEEAVMAAAMEMVTVVVMVEGQGAVMEGLQGVGAVMALAVMGEVEVMEQQQAAMEVAAMAATGALAAGMVAQLAGLDMGPLVTVPVGMGTAAVMGRRMCMGLLQLMVQAMVLLLEAPAGMEVVTAQAAVATGAAVMGAAAGE
jgi:hypothetical protein